MIASASITVICICAFSLFSFSRGDNPTSMVPPLEGPDPGYIVAESRSGLANRLRVLAAYMYIAEAKYQGAHLVFIWNTNEACPGHFLSVFEPIDQVLFATNASRYVVDKHAKQNYEESNAVFPWILKMNQIPRSRFGQPSWHDIEHRMYSRYVFRRELMFRAYAFIRRHAVCNMSAMHLRETDLSLHLQRQSGGRRKGVSRESYMQFVESAPGAVFLMTDNPATQQFFLQKYGPQKILVYEDMRAPINRLPLVLLNDSLIPPDASNTSIRSHGSHSAGAAGLPEDHRFTTLENTAIDVVIAAHALHFKASPFSSLSELVAMFSRIGRRDRGWCQQQR